MSSDLLTMVVYAWRDEAFSREHLTLELASRLPHLDDPALGVLLSNLVEEKKLSLSIDDRDLNHFSLNPSCNATYLMLHNRTWVVHHVDASAMRCMWEIDSATRACA